MMIRCGPIMTAVRDRIAAWLLPAALAALSSCVYVPIAQPPFIAETSARFTGIDERGVDAEFRVAIVNAAPYELDPPSLRYTLDVDGDSFASGEKISTHALITGRENFVTVPIRVDFDALRARREKSGIRPGRESTYRFAAEIAVPHGPETILLDTSGSGVVPVYRAPEFRLADLDRFDEKNGFVLAQARIEIRNAGTVAMAVGGLRYRIDFGDTVIGPLSATSKPSVDPGSAALVLATCRIRATDPAVALLAHHAAASARLIVSGAVETEFGSVPVK